MPKVSIIVPIYKVEDYLHKCINSVLNQTYQDWELLLIDDGSPDNSGTICDEYAKLEPKLRVFHKENGGVSSARNTGIQAAKGDWIMFLDADDWISEDCLEVCINEVTENNLDAIQFSFNKVFSDGRTIPQHKTTTPIFSPKQYLDNGNFNVCVWGGLYRHSIIERSRLLFDTNLNLAEDQVFVINFFKKASRLKYINEPMYFYYQNEFSATHNQKSKDLIEACTALTHLSEEWSPAKFYIDTMCIVLMTEIINNQDTPLSTIRDIYNDLSPKEISKRVSKSCYSFFKLSALSPLFSANILSLYFRFRKAINIFRNNN